jgi:3-phenylpropionate/trans-cinnamate dioxygenase ferredoxin subunit
MPFVRLAGVSELEPDQGFRVELGHEEYPLSEGWVEDHTIECALHGSRFDLLTGEPDSPPALRPVRIFPVKVEGEDVLVDLPDDWAKLANDL